MKDQITSLIRSVLSVETNNQPIELTVPENESFGDYSSNIAMVLAKKLGKNPRELAEEIKQKFEARNSKFEVIEKIEIAGPGFINFYLSQEYLTSFLEEVIDNSHWFKREVSSGSPLEYIENTQPNTNKPLHIGHLRNTALGVSMTNLRRALGKNSQSANINNDRGIHIVKAMWGYLQGARAEEPVQPYGDWRELLTQWIEDASAWKTPEQEKQKSDVFVGQYYVFGDKAEKEAEDLVKQQFSEMLSAWEEGDIHVRTLWKTMNGWFYEGFKETHARFLGISPEAKQFEKEWFESDIYDAGKQIALDNVGKGLFYKRDDGAIMAKLEKYNLPDKVVIRSDGTTVYITQDLELARMRIEDDHADFIAYVVGDEQSLHFQQLFAICEELGFGKRENYRHIAYGMVNLAGGVKMSSREGNVITADELMDSVKETVRSQFDQTDEEKLESIAIGAIKYWMLKYNPKAKIDFDLSSSVSIDGNSGPYLQYTYARTQSVLGKSEVPMNQVQGKRSSTFEKIEKLEAEESLLIRTLVHFPEVIEQSALNFQPNLLTNYLFDLAKKYNLFYQKHKIVGSEQEEFRIVLTQAVGQTLQSGLDLLGIQTVEGM